MPYAQHTGTGTGPGTYECECMREIEQHQFAQVQIWCENKFLYTHTRARARMKCIFSVIASECVCVCAVLLLIFYQPKMLNKKMCHFVLIKECGVKHTCIFIFLSNNFFPSFFFSIFPLCLCLSLLVYSNLNWFFSLWKILYNLPSKNKKKRSEIKLKCDLNKHNASKKTTLLNQIIYSFQWKIKSKRTHTLTHDTKKKICKRACILCPPHSVWIIFYALEKERQLWASCPAEKN